MTTNKTPAPWTNSANRPSKYPSRSSEDIRAALEALGVPECAHTDAVNFVKAGTGNPLWSTHTTVYSEGQEYSTSMLMTFSYGKKDSVELVRLVPGELASGRLAALRCEDGTEVHLALWTKCGNLATLTQVSTPESPDFSEIPPIQHASVPAASSIFLVALGLAIITLWVKRG